MNTPRRIVSLHSSATEILYLLGLGEQVVGVSHECDFPADATTKPRVTRSNVDSTAGSLVIDEQVKALLAAGAALYEIDVARLIELEPDLIVTQAQCDVCAVRYEDVLAAVANHPQLHGTPVVSLNPLSLDDVLVDIQRVADAAGVETSGQQVVAGLRTRIEAVRERSTVLGVDERPRVACIEWTEPLMLAANWMPEIVELSGGKHELTQGGVHSQYAAWDQLIHYNPQVVIVMPCGFDLKRSLVEAQALTTRSGWSELQAVQNRRVFAVDANAYFNRPGPRLVESLEILAHLIHPKLFPSPSRIDGRSAWRAVL